MALRNIFYVYLVGCDRSNLSTNKGKQTVLQYSEFPNINMLQLSIYFSFLLCY